MLGWKNPLEKGLATHSSILTWRIPWTEETGALQTMESQIVRHDYVTRERDPKSKTMMKCKGKYKQILEINIHKSRKIFVILLLTSI